MTLGPWMCHLSPMTGKAQLEIEGGLAPHPEIPNPEVPLGLFDGIRRWLGCFWASCFFIFFFFSSDFSRCFWAPRCV